MNYWRKWSAEGPQLELGSPSEVLCSKNLEYIDIAHFAHFNVQKAIFEIIFATNVVLRRRLICLCTMLLSALPQLAGFPRLAHSRYQTLLPSFANNNVRIP